MKRTSAVLASLMALTTAVTAAAADGDWPNYGRTPGGDRHSPLTQIDRANVASSRSPGNTRPAKRASRPATPRRSRPRRSSSTA